MRISDWSSDVCSSDLAAFGRINRLAGEDIDGAVLVERKAKAADPRKTIVPVIARHRCIGSREPSGEPRILGEGKCSALFDGRPEMIHENRLAREGQFMVDVAVAVDLRWRTRFEDRTCRRQVYAQDPGVPHASGRP